jgi:hypothetical protein
VTLIDVAGEVSDTSGDDEWLTDAIIGHLAESQLLALSVIAILVFAAIGMLFTRFGQALVVTGISETVNLGTGCIFGAISIRETSRDALLRCLVPDFTLGAEKLRGGQAAAAIRTAEHENRQSQN